MYLVRPADFADLPALERLAQQAGIGITNFPANRERLNDKIASSRRSLQTDVIQPSDESYLFVLIDTSKDEIVGCCGIDAMVGVDTPFYSYRIDEVVHASPQLQIHNRIPALFLCHDYSGTSRMIALVIDKAHQNHTAMSLLSKARLLFIARYPERFTTRLFVELRGESDKHGYSAFWDALGKHFFSMDFKKADYLSGVSNKHFIAELMPRYPIYVPTLPEAAQDAIGVVHEDSSQSTDILLAEGFEFRGYVDIFDAGPTLEARTESLHTIAQQTMGKALTLTENSQGPMHLISTGHLETFRVTAAPAEPQVAGLALEKTTLERLAVSSGSRIQWVAL
ncbi:arginine N-succinyltransferase [Marinomonas sp. M1K-6]|uniref:Arginine N-succinyltransferase n=1 Tax=Marinomonas profundi TaxID=2726122 RepID=A0A847R448_9GAMM|nr:arginine N-succinyltransferase [Marinomonas profundi]NLQ18745.1 arginine N-succinyltransferase [Marinomonas profundi]UDV04009.1 arginine N-succinyltransferase [Marinomonas profundi]